MGVWAYRRGSLLAYRRQKASGLITTNTNSNEPDHLIIPVRFFELSQFGKRYDALERPYADTFLLRRLLLLRFLRRLNFWKHRHRNGLADP